MHLWNDKVKADAGAVFFVFFLQRMGPPGVIQFHGAVMQYSKNLQLPPKMRVKGEQQRVQIIST